jgi:hypothetical protein
MRQCISYTESCILIWPKLKPPNINSVAGRSHRNADGKRYQLTSIDNRDGIFTGPIAYLQIVEVNRDRESNWTPLFHSMTGNNCEQQLQAPWLPDGYFVPSYTECIYKSSHEAARFEEYAGAANIMRNHASPGSRWWLLVGWESIWRLLIGSLAARTTLYVQGKSPRAKHYSSSLGCFASLRLTFLPK